MFQNATFLTMNVFGKLYDRELNKNLYVPSRVPFSMSLLVNLLTAFSTSFMQANFGTVCLELFYTIVCLLYVPFFSL